MHYSKIFRSANGTTQLVPQTSESKEDRLIKLVEKLAKNTQQIPQALQESKTSLSDDDVSIMLEFACKFQKKYFSDIPLAQDLGELKLFIFNLPKSIIAGMKYARNHPELPDVLNPVMFIYPLLTVNPECSIGLYWLKLMQLLDGNREAIEQDASSYIADMMPYDEDEDESEEENEEDNDNG